MKHCQTEIIPALRDPIGSGHHSDVLPSAEPYRARWWLWLRWLVGLVVVLTSSSSEAALPRLQVEAIDIELAVKNPSKRSAAAVEGVARYRLNRPAQPGESLQLLDFSAFLEDEPSQLDEVATESYVAGTFQAGHLTVLSERQVEVRRTRPSTFTATVEPGAASFILRYRVDVPRRYWPFGCVQDRCSLSGALAPLPSEPASGGASLPEGRVVTPVVWRVTELRFEADAKPQPKWRPDVQLIRVGGDGERTPYPSIFWGPGWTREQRLIAGQRIETYALRPRPSGRVPHEPGLQLRRDIVGHVFALAEQLIAVLDDLGGSSHDVVVVQGPLRSSIAQMHPGVVVISDQAFEVFPIPRLLKFHEEAVARALAEALVEPAVRAHQDASTAMWMSTQLGFALLSVWRRVQAVRDEYATDVLRGLTFVSTVDAFLYTQQAAFADSYFRGIEDQPALRNHPLWFSHELPTGRRLHEKLADTLTSDQLGRAYRSLFADPSQRVQDVMARAYGWDLTWFFDQWLGPYPSVNYTVDFVALDQGQRRYAIVLQQEGDLSVVEPVQVLVTERNGDTHYLVWNGEGVNHRFEVETASPIKHVRLDPRQRLVEHTSRNVDPKFDNRRPASFRFLFTGIDFSVSASELGAARSTSARLNAITGLVAFESSLRRDVRRTGHVLLSTDREAHLSVGLGANLWFGSLVNAQRRRARVRLFATTQLLNPESLDPVGGVRLIERVSVVDDTRRFTRWPERGHRLSAAIAARQIVGQRDPYVDLLVDVEWRHLWHLAHHHVIATALRGEIVIPLRSTPEFRSLTRAGGVDGLTAYLADEAFGRGLLTAHAEYRHPFMSTRSANLLNLAWLRYLGGALFVGGASHSSCDSLGEWFSPSSFLAEVGYGITARLALLGVAPQLVRVEAAVPLIRQRGVTCRGETLPDLLAERQGREGGDARLPPVNVSVLFGHRF